MFSTKSRLMSWTLDITLQLERYNFLVVYITLKKNQSNEQNQANIRSIDVNAAHSPDFTLYIYFPCEI
ncbi:hypothetical protein MtrunA17_Chr7g0237851 [Medicago truncatula]|uniref:Uncharacterized protein n=1 Tax=Medicago truncatula TaxID=3880 RepID=A0A396GY60_MEDTR|nr:hypothetical protein MtrunA17_Chr7g0237851 [Medicago truncatula]